MLPLESGMSSTFFRWTRWPQLPDFPANSTHCWSTASNPFQNRLIHFWSSHVTCKLGRLNKKNSMSSFWMSRKGPCQGPVMYTYVSYPEQPNHCATTLAKIRTTIVFFLFFQDAEDEYLVSCLLMVFVAVSIPKLARAQCY